MLDHNNVTSISNDFSLLLQSFQDNQIRLGDNPWQCQCGAEITDRVRTIDDLDQYQLLIIQNLQSKVSDLKNVYCGEGSNPKEIVGLKVCMLQVLKSLLLTAPPSLISGVITETWSVMSFEC